MGGEHSAAGGPAHAGLMGAMALEWCSRGLRTAKATPDAPHTLRPPVPRCSCALLPARQVCRRQNCAGETKPLTATVLRSRRAGLSALLRDADLAGHLTPPHTHPTPAPLAAPQPYTLAHSLRDPGELRSSVGHVLTRARQHFLHLQKTS